MLSLTHAYPILAHELEDRLCAELGLELRRPYWNAKLVQFFFTCPEELRQQGATNKHLHRQAMAGLLPEQVLKRTSKAEFSTTYLRHLTGMRAALVDEIPTRKGAWITAHRVAELYETALGSGSSAGWAKKRLWNLFGCDSIS